MPIKNFPFLKPYYADQMFQGKEEIVYTIDETLIDFMPNLHCALLGVGTFLNQFILTIDYPGQIFSIRKP
jgi:hypothetical protein